MRQDDFISRLAAPDSLEFSGKIHFEKYGTPLSPNHSFQINTPDFISGKRMIEVQKIPRYVILPLHSNEYIETIYVLSGSCTHMINDTAYLRSMGDFLVIPPGYSHTVIPEGNSLCLSISIQRNAFIEMRIPKLADYVNPLLLSCGEDPFVKTSIVELLVQQESALPYFKNIMLQLFQVVLLYITQHYYESSKSLVLPSSSDARMIEILNYMMEDYQNITLESTALHFHYNPSYFSRMFHDKMGMTFSAVLKEYRLRQAAKLLSEKHYKLDDLCEKIGYKDTSQFIRNFKEMYKVTPIRYGKAVNENTDE